MSSTPLVSVIVPVYNTEKEIVNCLASIQEQTLADIEIICIDDCSSDKSLEVISNIAQKDKRIRVLSNHKNSGPGLTRNKGLLEAKGEYVGFVDSDDKISTNFYEKLYKSAAQNDADICGGSLLRSFNNVYYIREEEESATDTEEKMKLSFCYKWGSVCDKIFRRTMLEKNDVQFPSISHHEDMLFLFESMFFANKFVAVPNVLYFYQDNPFSLSHQADFSSSFNDVYQKMFEFANAHHFEEAFLNCVKLIGNFEIVENK